MSEDIREQILVRLEAILNMLSNGTDIKVYRDRAEFSEQSELPAYVLLDGTEALETRSSDRRGPQIMRLLPQIFFVPIPPENQLNEGIGQELSEARVKLIKGIMQDGPLKDILGDNGYAEYRGFETDMQTGGEVKGQFRMDFAFAYAFNFNRL